MPFDSAMLAYCGLYCEQCSTRAAYEENDRKHLEGLPFDWAKRELSAYRCEGCKGRNICGHCSIRPCASARGLESCADCGDFPCGHIEAFAGDGMPHHRKAVENLEEIRRLGAAAWYDRLEPELRCACGERQSWYYSCPRHAEPARRP